MDLTLVQALFPLVGILMIIAGAAVLMRARRLYSGDQDRSIQDKLLNDLRGAVDVVFLMPIMVIAFDLPSAAQIRRLTSTYTAGLLYLTVGVLIFMASRS